MNTNLKPKLHKNWIDPHAFGIVRALQKAGYTSYLVGGCVRDLLLGIQPKDFDIGTEARPEQVRRLIFKSFIIGKRFRLVLVKRDEQQFEVATFRKDQPSLKINTLESDNNSDGDSDPEFPTEEQTEPQTESLPEVIKSDNYFGSPQEDANRRDFTINGLFYDPVADELIDYANGLTDLESGWVKMIGEPKIRLAEDPIRILRALRLAHMIDFQLTPDLRSAMQEQGHLLRETALPRRREEILKLLRLKRPALAFLEAYDLGFMKYLCPALEPILCHEESATPFLQYLEQLPHYSLKKSNPVELFAHLVLAYVRSSIQKDFSQLIKPSEWDENKDLIELMRDQLGMFKSEMISVIKALQMQSQLVRTEDFARRGHKRQEAIARNETFPLAIKLAISDLALSPSQIIFWNSVRSSSGPHRESQNRRPQRRRRRKAPRDRRGSSVATGLKTKNDGSLGDS